MNPNFEVIASERRKPRILKHSLKCLSNLRVSGVFNGSLSNVDFPEKESPSEGRGRFLIDLHKLRVQVRISVFQTDIIGPINQESMLTLRSNRREIKQEEFRVG